MLGLPKTTEFDKRIPKQKFYEKLSVPPALKKAFKDQIRFIYWKNKLAAATLNLAAGSRVKEIEVIEVKLRAKDLDENVLRLMDREIPYHILFLLEYEGTYQAVMGYKEAAASGSAAFKVERYYRTGWLPEEELPLQLEGLTLDGVYENFIRQLAGGTLSGGEGSTLKESVEREKKKEKLQKEIARLEAKMRKEKQLNWKIEIRKEIKKLRAQLEEI